MGADCKPPVDLFKSIFSDSESESEKEDSDSEPETENLTILKKPEQPKAIENTPEQTASGNGKLSWSRFGQPPTLEPPKAEPVKVEKEPELDEFDRPKFTFTAKKDRTTTKPSSRGRDVKTQPRDSDEGIYTFKLQRVVITIESGYL